MIRYRAAAQSPGFWAAHRAAWTRAVSAAGYMASHHSVCWQSGNRASHGCWSYQADAGRQGRPRAAAAAAAALSTPPSGEVTLTSCSPSRSVRPAWAPCAPPRTHRCGRVHATEWVGVDASSPPATAAMRAECRPARRVMAGMRRGTMGREESRAGCACDPKLDGGHLGRECMRVWGGRGEGVGGWGMASQFPPPPPHPLCSPLVSPLALSHAACSRPGKAATSRRPRAGARVRENEAVM